MNKRQLRATFRKYLFGFTFEVISLPNIEKDEERPGVGELPIVQPSGSLANTNPETNSSYV